LICIATGGPAGSLATAVVKRRHPIFKGVRNDL
jgi:hypothetical protein